MMAVQLKSSSFQPANLQPILQIRPMQLEDLEQVHAIDRASFSMPWPESSYRYELMENPNSRSWVAITNGPDGNPLVSGAVVIWLIEDEAHIATIAVHPEYRGRGISRELLAVALMNTTQEGARVATLEVRANNLIAQALYRRFRFEIVSRRPRYYRDNNEDALIMTASGLDETYLRWLVSGGWKQ
jgi:ribosomal-protein-alanine N-acetyltransferase